MIVGQITIRYARRRDTSGLGRVSRVAGDRQPLPISPPSPLGTNANRSNSDATPKRKCGDSGLGVYVSQTGSTISASFFSFGAFLPHALSKYVRSFPAASSAESCD